MSTAFLDHPAFDEHQTGWKHPESRRRLTAIRERLAQAGLKSLLLHLEPREATEAELARVHDPAYVRRLAEACAAGGLFNADPDTIGSPGTFRAACFAAGAVLTAVDAVMDGRVRNAFCAVRPPGHHAERDHAMGFCFFNNVAIGARYAQDRHGLGRIAILDWDVHHGNGTQHAFEDDPSVFYVSLHQVPLYPGSGRHDERGRGPGAGFTLNLPLGVGSTLTDYRRAFEGEIRPALRAFRPEFVFVSAGFDAHRDDPLAGLALSAEDFGELTDEALAIARESAQGRLVSVLEGGYNLAALADSVEAHLRRLLTA
jgi:acetoin utilization deacetylase AcuC-like enzyme